MAQARTRKPAARRASQRPSSDSLRDRFGLRQSIQARLLGVSLKTASNLRSGRAPTPQLARRLNELSRLLSALAEVVEEDVVAEWLETPNDSLGGLKPLEVIERGEADRIWQMIHALGSGEPA